MNKKILIAISLFLIFVLVFIFKYNFAQNAGIQKQKQIIENNANNLQAEVNNDQLNNIKKGDAWEVVENKKVDNVVPFVVQAPFGNWKDPVFQDGCEEASVMMAMGWVKGIEKISPEEAFEQIKEIAEFEDKNFGFNANTDLEDVKNIFIQYFYYQKVGIKEDINAEDIIDELNKGNIVLVPAFGQALKNLNFTQPGPVAHMLVVKGYDKKTGEFITNDPGTKRGESYRYKKDVLFDAIWQYPRGKDKLKVPEREDMRKGMIVITK